MANIKFYTCLLTLIIALMLQLNSRDVFGWSPEFVLGTMIVFAFYLEFIELAALTSVSALALNWQPSLNLELLLIAILPMIIFGVKKFLPWRNAINNFLAILSALLIFYGATNYAALSGYPFLFPKIVFGNLIFGGLLFQTFGYFYKPVSKMADG